MDVTYVLLVVVALAALAGLVVASTRRAWEVPLYVVGALAAATVYGSLGSPWIEAKAFAIASPAVVLAAVLGGLVLFGRRRVEGAVLLGVIALGIGWSNVLAYGDATLAPRDQLAELETIGDRFAGQGPALMTEYQPYGVRHFLRRLDAEGASELRRRVIPLRDGSTVPKGGFADLAAFRPDAILPYRTLVLRRTPVGTRPPSPYRLVWQKRFYEVWQRPEVAQVAATDTRCAQPLTAAGTTVTIPVTGQYDLWASGSVRGKLAAVVDGREVGSIRHQLNYTGQYSPLGRVELTEGTHTVEGLQSLSRLRPGQGGAAWSVGPVLVTPANRCG